METLKKLPEVGELYNHYNDGKITPSRHSVVKVTAVVPYNEVDNEIKDIILEEQKNCDWLYAQTTDYVIFAEAVNEDDSEYKNRVYIRTIDGGWFSIDYKTFLESGRLDIDHTLTDIVKNDLLEENYDYSPEETEEIFKSLI